MASRISYTVVVIVLVTVALLGLGILAAFRVHSATPTHHAATLVDSLGGRMDCGEQLSYTFQVGNISTTAGSVSATFMEETGSFNTAREVCLIDLSGAVVDDDAAEIVARVADCTILSLKNTRVSKLGLARLCSLPNLEIIDLRGLSIEAELVEILGQSTKLRFVILSKGHSKVEDVGSLAKRLSMCEIVVD